MNDNSESEFDPANNPHDTFVRFVMSDPVRMRQLLEWYLPEDVTQLLKLETLRPAKERFVNSVLEESSTDLLFEVELKEPDRSDVDTSQEKPSRIDISSIAIVTVILEHKSYPDANTVLQVLRYQVRVWEEQLKLRFPLSCVIPMVLYHGTAPWNKAKTMTDLLQAPSALMPFVPSFDLPLIDLHRMSDDEIGRENLLKMVLFLLKYVRSDDFDSRMPDLSPRIAELIKSDASKKEFVCAMFKYISSTSSAFDLPALTKLSRDYFPEGQPYMSTIMQKLREESLKEGLKEGLEEGIEKGKVLGKIQLLEQLLGLTETPVEQLQEQNLDALQNREADLASKLQTR